LAENPQTQEKLRQGIEAAQRGDKTAARRLLQQVLTDDGNSELGWMWMAMVVEDLDERRACLQRALKINPNNARAREALRRLGGDVPPLANAAATPTEGFGERFGDAIGALNRSNNRTLYFGIAGAVAVLLVAILLASLLGGGGGAPSDAEVAQTATAFALAQAPIDIGLQPTPIPVTPSATRFTGIVVTLGPDDVVLPPTFTPTATNTPEATPLPSATPYPLGIFPLIYSASGDSAQNDLFGINADGSGGSELAADSGRDVVYSPNGSQIAFVRDIPGTPTGLEAEATPSDAASVVPQLFVAPANDPASARQLTQVNGPNMSRPAWTPDGTQIVFSSNQDGDEDLYIISVDGGDPQPIGNTDYNESDPVVSPDGRTLVFASDLDTPGSKEIYSAPITGGAYTRLTNASGSSYAPMFSPDGLRIAFVSDRSGDSDIYVMDANGQRPFLVTIDDGNAEDRSPVWTPDGSWIAFASDRGGGDSYQIYLISPDGTTLLPVTTGGGSVQSVSMQPVELP
jgi:Tol biopolymer transport system component